MTTITIPRALLKQALEALSCGGGDDDPGHRCSHCDDYVDRNGGVRAALRAELAKPMDASYTATQLAAMVLSDCGISTNHTALHERVAARISQHEVDLLDRFRKLAKPPTPARHDAPETIALKAERDAMLELLVFAASTIKSEYPESQWDEYRIPEIDAIIVALTAARAA